MIIFALSGKNIFDGYILHPQMIEYFRLKIENSRLASGGSIYKYRPKKDRAKRFPQIFNLQSSIFNSGSSGLGFSELRGVFVPG